MVTRLSVLLLLLALTGSAQNLVTRTIEYKDGDTVLSGYLVVDTSKSGKRPGILICHAWKGLGKHEKDTAERLARLGYVAFALDIYGKGVRAESAKEARALSSKYKSNRDLLRRRVNAGLARLKEFEQVDPAKTAAIGFCFGGTTVLELARSGAETLGVVSFHGGLGTPTPKDARKIKAKVLVLHGGDDPHAPISEVVGLIEEMKKADVDWQVTLYGGAVHSFTDPGSGNDPSRGAAYDKQAATRSWQDMLNFFNELF